MRVALLGLGNMGSAIAGRVLRAGHELVVWNRTEAKTAPLVAVGARAGASPRAAVGAAEVVLTSLMDDRSELETLQGETGFLGAMQPEAIHLCLTTISPGCADRLAAIHREHGTRFVSGPVAGRPDSAAAGQLITFLAGEAGAVEAVTSLCAAYARKVVPFGERAGLANSMKLCVNYTAVSIIELMGEIYAFGERSGIDPEVIREFFLDAFAHPALKSYATKLKDSHLSSAGGFALQAGLKDVRLMLAASAEAGVAFDIAKIVERKMQKAIGQGLGQADWSAIALITREESGLAGNPTRA